MSHHPLGAAAPRALVASSIRVEIPGLRTLINDLSLTLNPGDKLGVVGAEGTGKSTLLRVLAKQNVSGMSVQGHVTGPSRPGLLEQSLPDAWRSVGVAEYLLSDEVGEDISSERWNDLQQAVDVVLTVGLNPDLVTGEQMLGELSGGESVRIRLAKLLMDEPDVWLLDEPTNDLDIPTLEWLEQFLLSRSEPIAFISHDETLLENSANRILYLQRNAPQEPTEFRFEAMGYYEFVDFRRRGIEKQEQEAANQRRDRLRAEQILREHKSRIQSAQEKTKDSSARRLLNKRMRVVTTREAKLERNPVLEQPDDVEAIQIEFPKALAPPRSRVLLDLQLPELTVGGRTLARNVKLHIRGPQKVVIVGKNGSGKTTLIRQVVERLESAGADYGYFPQNYEDELENPEQRAIDYVRAPEREVDTTLAGILMDRLRFTRDEVHLPVGKLSGGQRAKVVLLRLMTGSGFLVLDEPTRNLSPLSNDAIRSALSAYPGAILAVSHDRAFVRGVAERVLELTPSGLGAVSFPAATKVGN